VNRERGHLIRNFEELVGMRGGWLAMLRRRILEAAELAVRSVTPENFMRRMRIRGNILRIGGEVELDLNRFDEIIVLGAGKASIEMARYVENVLSDRISGGLVVAPIELHEKHGLKHLEVLPSTHPLPSELGLKASMRMMEYAESVDEKTLVLFLLSGGASALLPYPAPPVTLEDKIRTARLFIRSGASIEEFNTVRKHLSLIKGGWLGKKLSKARVISLILSDVVGDRVEVIGSGPTAPDPTTFKDAYEVLRRYGIWDEVPETVRVRILKGMSGEVEETPKPGDPAFKRITNIVMAGVGDACRAAASHLRSMNFKCDVLSRFMEGEASQVGFFLAGVLRELSGKGGGRAIICGGETVVTVRGRGVGGRNQELALAASIKIKELRGCALLSMGTDGIDGVSDAAGAVVDPQTYVDAMREGLDPLEYLRENDSNTFFKRVGGAIYTGPTGTNVGDIVILASKS